MRRTKQLARSRASLRHAEGVQFPLIEQVRLSPLIVRLTSPGLARACRQNYDKTPTGQLLEIAIWPAVNDDRIESTGNTRRRTDL